MISESFTLLKNFWDGEIPVDIEKIVSCHNFLLKFENELHEDINYLSSKSNNRDFKNVLQINNNRTYLEKRFLIACAISHFYLNHFDNHFDNEKTFIIDECKTIIHRRHDNDVIQKIFNKQAIKFAQEVLMPSNKIVDSIIKDRIFDVETLSNNFKVSKDNMYFRLNNLGFIRTYIEDIYCKDTKKFECHHCGEKFPVGELINNNGKLYCKNCVNSFIENFPNC